MEFSRGHSTTMPASRELDTTPYRTKKEIASHFRVSVTTIEEWVRLRVIPVYKPSPRKNLYHVARCEAALARFEVKEVGRA